MANFLDKIKVKTALDDRVKLDLSSNHISTANFMQFNVAWSKELVPKEKISISMETFTRLQPMPVPTFGRANINNRCFFVPFRTIMPGWNDFITDSPHTIYGGNSGIITSVPTIDNSVFVTTLTRSDNGYMEEVDSEAAYDISVNDGSGTITYYSLTGKGRQIIKILESLGYKIIWIEGSWEDEPSYSALPLLAAAKVYYDWYFPSAYANSDARSAVIEGFFKIDSLSYNFNAQDLVELLNFVSVVNYDSDYFVSAWDNPYNPNNGTFSSINLKDPSNGSNTTYDRYVNVSASTNGTGNNGAPIVSGTVSSGSTYGQNLQALSQWAVDALKSLTDYMKRHQLVGARALDRYLARFGVNLTAEKLNRSLYLGTQSQPLQFGDVMSQSDTEGAALGNYAGKGLSYGDGKFEFETDEYGLMLIISTIVPVTGYYQGVNRNVLHVTKLDYWTPEFDNLGTQAISKQEVYSPMRNAGSFTGLTYLPNQIFGWTPRYAEYKVGRDNITGDFRYASLNGLAGNPVNSDEVGTGGSWHLMRTFNYDNAADIVHNVNFVKGLDANQYSRIFYNTDAEIADKFNVIYNFNVASYSPMKSLFDTYEFDSHGKEVTEDVNGVKMN